MAVVRATYYIYLCVQYWSAIVYNAEVAVNFSELPCLVFRITLPSIQNYPDLPHCNSRLSLGKWLFI